MPPPDLDQVLRALDAELAALDEGAAVTDLAREMNAAFAEVARRASRAAPGVLLTRLRYSWAGAEVPPFVASDVMSHAYAGPRKVVDCGPGFTPTPVDLVAQAADEHAGLTDIDGFEALHAQALATSVRLARSACALAVAGPGFLALAAARPFTITVRPGHDEPEVELLVVP